MFRVTDSVEKRQQFIRKFIEQDEHAVAVLLAAADCERTIRRAIQILGVTPKKELAYQLGRRRPAGEASSTDGQKPKFYGSSIKAYHRAWNKEIYKGREIRRRLLGDVAKDKKNIERAFNLRHELIHGEKGTTGKDYARRQVEVLMEVTRSVDQFVRDNHGDPTASPLRRVRLTNKRRKSDL